MKPKVITLDSDARIIIKTRFGLLVIDDHREPKHIQITQAKNRELAEMLRNEVGDVGRIMLSHINMGV